MWDDDAEDQVRQQPRQPTREQQDQKEQPEPDRIQACKLRQSTANPRNNPILPAQRMFSRHLSFTS